MYFIFHILKQSSDFCTVCYMVWPHICIIQYMFILSIYCEALTLHVIYVKHKYHLLAHLECVLWHYNIMDILSNLCLHGDLSNTETLRYRKLCLLVLNVCKAPGEGEEAWANLRVLPALWDKLKSHLCCLCFCRHRRRGKEEIRKDCIHKHHNF